MPLFVDKLANLSKLALWKMVLDWQVEEDEYKETADLTPYFKTFPNEVCDSLLQFWNRDYRGIELFPDARQVSLLIYPGIERLNLGFTGFDDFDMQFLLCFNKKKLENLKSLGLPPGYLLTMTRSKMICKKLKKTSPGLQELKLPFVTQERALIYIANLPLMKVFIPDLTEAGARYLCSKNSLIKGSLRVISTIDGLSDRCVCLIVKIMKQIERVSCPRSSWLNRLVNEVGPIELNLKSIQFRPSDVVFGDHLLQLASTMCPKAEEIRIFANPFRQKIIWFLTKFKNLKKLTLGINPQFSMSQEVDHLLSGEVNLDNVVFPNLLELSLHDRNGQFLFTGNFYTMLEMFPNLEKLKFLFCDEFTNKGAIDLAEFIKDKKLKYISIEYCNMLYSNAIEELMAVPSLEKLKVELFVNRSNRPGLELLKERIRGTPLQKKVILVLSPQIG